jgi:hypothetical protein
MDASRNCGRDVPCCRADRLYAGDGVLSFDRSARSPRQRGNVVLEVRCHRAALRKRQWRLVGLAQVLPGGVPPCVDTGPLRPGCPCSFAFSVSARGVLPRGARLLGFAGVARGGRPPGGCGKRSSDICTRVVVLDLLVFVRRSRRVPVTLGATRTTPEQNRE